MESLNQSNSSIISVVGPSGTSNASKKGASRAGRRSFFVSLIIFSGIAILFVMQLYSHNLYQQMHLLKQYHHDRLEELMNLPLGNTMIFTGKLSSIQNILNPIEVNNKQNDNNETHYHPLGPVQLTIAVDSYVSCPDKCVFVHHYLPSWVQYRYINFRDESDLEAILQDDNLSHLLILARTNIIKLSKFAVKRRQVHNK
jgi:hypothetical protein